MRPMASRRTAVIKVRDTGKLVSPWISPSSRHGFSQASQAEHEANMIEDAEKTASRMPSPTRATPKLTRAPKPEKITSLLAQGPEELKNREAEADQRERRANDGHQGSVFGEPRALERHAGAPCRELGVDVELRIGAADRRRVLRAAAELRIRSASPRSRGGRAGRR